MLYALSGIRPPAVPLFAKPFGSSLNGDRRSSSLPLLLRKNSTRKIFAQSMTNDSDESDSEEQVNMDEVEIDDGLEQGGKVNAGDSQGAVKTVPPPGSGQEIYENNFLLHKFRGHLDYRFSQYRKMREAIDVHEGGLEVFSRGYEQFGFIRSENGVTYREWAPGALSASLVGGFNDWSPHAHPMSRNDNGVWEIYLPNNADGSSPIPHGTPVKIRMDTLSGLKYSTPAWIKYCVKTPGDESWNSVFGIYYDPPEEEKYVFKHPQPKRPNILKVAQAHIGRSRTNPMINTYANFRDVALPLLKKIGFNGVQIMIIQEYSEYYGTYRISNFYAPRSRFGTPEDLKSLIDKAHELGMYVMMQIVHSHAGHASLYFWDRDLNWFDGTEEHYFHSGTRGVQLKWLSRNFNYGKWEVLRYLLSNARWWLEEYKFDGLRFHGVTSMMYEHHGLKQNNVGGQMEFTGNYGEYFGSATDVDAVVYLMLVNDMIHALYPEAVTLGEDFSGMPTFCEPVAAGGVGFDMRVPYSVNTTGLFKSDVDDWLMGDITSEET